jgi:hypothetical protein
MSHSSSVLLIAFTNAKMTDKKDFPPAGCSFQPSSAVKIFTLFQTNNVIGILLPATVLVMLAMAPLRAQAQCTASYEPGTQSQRITTGLFDGRVGPIKVVNNTENATLISLYHPDAPKRVFKYWYAEPGEGYLLGTDHYSSDWGIQVDDGPICLVGRVASWDSSTFTTFPSRLFITEAPPSLKGTPSSSQPLVAQPPSPQIPADYEAIARKQLAEGEIRGSLLSLLRAADLYKASGQVAEEKRVRDRIKQIRGN